MKINWTQFIHQASATLTLVMGFLSAFDFSNIISHKEAGVVLLCAGVAKIIFNQLAGGASS